MRCPFCTFEGARLMKHVEQRHPAEFIKQQRLCLQLYRGGLSAQQIADREDVLYDNRMSVCRAVKRTSGMDLESGALRAVRIRRTENAESEPLEARLGSIYGDNREHIADLLDLSVVAGLELDERLGILYGHGLYVLIIPNTRPYADYSNLMSEFITWCGDSKHLIFHLDELHRNKDLVVSMIRARLGRLPNRVFARQCELYPMTPKEASEFFNTNHISGHVVGKWYCGLRYNGQIVAAMSLRRPFITKYSGWIEIARYAVAMDHSVVGGFSRLLMAASNYAINRYTHILSYCDLRYGNGGVYETCGFSTVGKTVQDYGYTDGVSRYNRFKFRAANGLSEKYIANAAGVYRICGVGSAIYSLPVVTPS